MSHLRTVFLYCHDSTVYKNLSLSIKWFYSICTRLYERKPLVEHLKNSSCSCLKTTSLMLICRTVITYIKLSVFHSTYVFIHLFSIYHSHHHSFLPSFLSCSYFLCSSLFSSFFSHFLNSFSHISFSALHLAAPLFVLNTLIYGELRIMITLNKKAMYITVFLSSLCLVLQHIENSVEHTVYLNPY
jgi:hypothetical protein